jgi:hypothetical protein
VKPKVVRYASLAAVNAFTAWLYPVGWFFNVFAGLAFFCAWLAAFHYKPAKKVDPFMDIECWAETLFDLAASKAYGPRQT